MRHRLVALLASTIAVGAIGAAPAGAETKAATKTYLLSLESTGPGKFVPFGVMQVSSLSSKTGTWDLASRGLSGTYYVVGSDTRFVCTSPLPTLAGCLFEAHRGLFVAYSGTYFFLPYEGPLLTGNFELTKRL